MEKTGVHDDNHSIKPFSVLISHFEPCTITMLITLNGKDEEINDHRFEQEIFVQAGMLLLCSCLCIQKQQ